uniref:Rh blood group, D antigen n=1 Tax=Neolamprologus brichardi TaxID=32507 RepID=A0A3Q4MLF3_NEOBR
MPPQYAPSLRSRLAPLLLFLQTGFIIIFAFYTEIERNGNADDFSKRYPGEFYFCELERRGWFILNKWLLQFLLNTRPLISIMMLHIFGSLFGLMLTGTLYRKGSEQRFEKEKFDTKMGLFSMLGTVFLWMFWPSFNSVLVEDRTPGRKLEAVCSTYLALAVSAVTAAAVSVLSNPKGKLNLIHMLLAFQCHDTCAVLSSHALPGLLGWIAQLVLQIKDSDDHTVAIRFAVFHICSLLITIALSVTLGILTGMLKFWRPPQYKNCFDDQAFWEVCSHLL